MSENINMTDNKTTEKKKWTSRHVIKSGVPVFSCVASYEEKPDQKRHIKLSGDTYNALLNLQEEYEDSVSTALVAGDVVADAAEHNWKPFDKPINYKLTFNNLTADTYVAMTKTDIEKVEKLSQACNIKVHDYIRLALCWKLDMHRSFTEKPQQ